MKPPCHNRPPAAEGRWLPTGMMRFNLIGPGASMKAVYRWRPRWFEDRCATWDGTGIGPNGERYPQAHGFDCAGCRWLPTNISTGQRLTEAQVRAARIAARESWNKAGDTDQLERYGDPRKAAIERIAEYHARGGTEPVTLTCGDHVVGRIDPPQLFLGAQVVGFPVTEDEE